MPMEVGMIKMYLSSQNLWSAAQIYTHCLN